MRQNGQVNSLPEDLGIEKTIEFYNYYRNYWRMMFMLQKIKDIESKYN